MTTQALTQDTMPTLRHSFPIEAPVQDEYVMAQKVKAGLEVARVGIVKLASASGHVVAEVGRWIGRHRVGVSYTIGAVAAGVAVYNTLKGVGDLNYSNSVTTAANNISGIDNYVEHGLPDASESQSLAVGGLTGIAALGCALIGMTLNAERKGRSEPKRQHINRPYRKPNPQYNWTGLRDIYVRPTDRLTWLDENDVRV